MYGGLPCNGDSSTLSVLIAYLKLTRIYIFTHDKLSLFVIRNRITWWATSQRPQLYSELRLVCLLRF